MRPTRISCIFILSAVTTLPASAALFPKAVEKQVTLTGAAAVSAAELFGMAPGGDSTVSLELGKPEAWAVYLLKQDTKERLSSWDGMPARYDAIQFSSAPAPSLTISPYWLALGTRLPFPKEGYFSFASPFLSAQLTEDGPWARLVRRLKASPGWTETAQTQVRRCVVSQEGTELCIEVLRAEDYTDNIKRIGHLVMVTARPGKE